MSEINIYFFADTKEIFDKIFPKKGEIIEKKYGSIETRLFPKEEKNSLIQNFVQVLNSASRKIETDMRIFFPKYKKNENKLLKYINWKGYKYPNLSKDNINDILNDLIESLKSSNNKNNIIIKFGINYAKAFRKMSNSFNADHPFILFNLSENDKVEPDFFEIFKYPQYISYIKDKLIRKFLI